MFKSRKTRTVFTAGVAVVSALALVGCSSSNPLEKTPDASGSETIVVGSQAYYSNEIIAEIYAQALEAAGLTVDRQFNIGQRDAYMPELESGAVDVFPEYTGNLLEYLDKDATATSPEDVYAALEKALPDELVALDYAEASDQDTYTVLKSYAEENNLTTIGDLAKIAEKPTIGAAPEFEQRPYGPSGAKDVYAVELDFSATGESTLDALLSGTVQVADIYTADPAFKTEAIIALEDPENMILASNVVPLVSADVKDKVADVLNKVSAALGEDDLVELNVKSTVDQQSAADIAKSWLKDNDLL